MSTIFIWTFFFAEKKFANMGILFITNNSIIIEINKENSEAINNNWIPKKYTNIINSIMEMTNERSE
jgi:hypothetical protein